MVAETMIGLIIGSIIFSLAYLSVNLGKDHGILQMFFLAMSMGTIPVGALFIVELAPAGVEAMTSIYYVFTIFIVVTVIIYIAITMLMNAFEEWGILDMFKKRKRERRYDE